jgi:hypothetical protein
MQILKTVVVMTVWEPTFCMYSFIMSGVLNGVPWARTKETIKREYLGTIYDVLRIWTLVSFINQRFIPSDYKTVFLDFMGIFWDLMLSDRIADKPAPAPAAIKNE